jgi:hypothetical protein
MRTENENKIVNFLKSKNEHFIKACSDAEFFGKSGKKEKGIPETKRQASRWLRGRGIAYKTHKGLI